MKIQKATDFNLWMNEHISLDFQRPENSLSKKMPIKPSTSMWGKALREFS